MIRNAERSRPAAAAAHPRQRGIALIVVLILLVMMTLLALVSLRGTLMQERMSSNQYDRSLGFQSTEAALREGEAAAAKITTAPGGGCAGPGTGVCGTPASTDTPRWLLDDASWKAIAKPSGDADLGLAINPSYIIEYMGEFPGKSCTTSGDVSNTGCTDLEKHYRITARSYASNRADVTLQTNYAVP